MTSQVHDYERPFVVPKEVLDTCNSISWFFLDACWMMNALTWAYFMVVPTLVTGLLLLYIDKRKPVFFINLAINAWILMNCLWMFGDTLPQPMFLIWARFALVAGLGCILLAAWFSKDLKETFSHFKRFRVLRF